jgi:hypothetical protein
LITSDLSVDQVRSALLQGLPALRQPAQQTLFGDGVLDGAVFAYGTHHIPPKDRPETFKEAFRTIRPGGRVVVQDFEEGTPTARWYSEALHRYTATGHDCAHFTRNGLGELLENAGFVDVATLDVDDSFRIEGNSPAEARSRTLRHVVGMFGLIKIPRRAVEDDEALHELLRPFMAGDLSVSRAANRRWIGILPRVALVAVGTKPVPTRCLSMPSAAPTISGALELAG